MEPNNRNKPQNDPASTPDEEKKSDQIGRHFSNELQFDEAVLRLREEYDRHPKQAKGIFY